MTVQPITADELQFDQADRLRKALRLSGVGVQEMADELGVNRETVGRYINGRTRAKRATLAMWSMRTGVPVQWLETGLLAEQEPGSEGDARLQGFEPRTF